MQSEDTIIGPQMGYVEILNGMTHEIIEENSKRQRSSPLRPSSAGKCERELGYEYAEHKGYQQYPPSLHSPEVHRLLNFGRSVETHLIWEIKDAFKRLPNPISIRYQQQTLDFCKLPDGTRVEGQIDLTLISEKYKCVADVKSKKDKFSSYYKTSWEELAGKLTEMKSVKRFGDEAYWVNDLTLFLKELDDPFFASNFVQLNMYFFDEHSFLRSRGIDHAVIFQYNKNDSRIREIRFKPSQVLYEDVVSKFTRVVDVVTRDKSPESLKKDYTLGSSKCAYCRFNKQCWPKDDALRDHFKTLPPKWWSKKLEWLAPEVAETLRKLFNDYEAVQQVSESLGATEEQIIKVMEQNKIGKIKLDDGKVYQTKKLKSGGPSDGPRIVLRRTKD